MLNPFVDNTLVVFLLAKKFAVKSNKFNQ